MRAEHYPGVCDIYRYPDPYVARLKDIERQVARERLGMWVKAALLVLAIVGFVICGIGIAHAQSLSPDGATLMPGQSGSLVTSEGTWTFNAAVANAQGSQILLNGKSTGGTAGELEFADGAMWAFATGDSWYEWVGGKWTKQAGTPPVASSSSSSSSATYSITVSWVLPTQYTDETAFPAGATVSVQLLQASAADINSLAPVPGADAVTGTTFKVTGLAAGTYCYAGIPSVNGARGAMSAITAGGTMCAKVPGQSTVKIPMAITNVSATETKQGAQ